MTAATIAAIGIFAYPVVASAYLFVSSERIRWETFFAVSHVLRSHAPDGSGGADESHPQGRSAVAAGVERGGVPEPRRSPGPLSPGRCG